MNRYKVKKNLTKMKDYILQKTSDKTAESKDNYKKRIRRYRLAALRRFLLVATVLTFLAIVVYIQYKNHIYTGYDYISENTVNRVGNSKLLKLGDSILTYSKDGAHCTDIDGVEVWNQTFEMQSPMVAICGNVAALSDYNGREIYVYNTTGKICQINTSMPIKNIAVAESGRTAVEVIDGKVTWIYIYDADGTEAFAKRTTMSQSGYPAAFSLSPNGELLGMSCIFVDAGTLKSQVAFYNFGPVGENKSNLEVNAYIYPDVIIPYIQFMTNDMAVAVGDDRLLFYAGEQIPTLLTSQMFEDEVQAIYQNNEYLGVIFRSDKLQMRNKMDVFRSDSEKVGTFYFNTAFREILFTDNYFVAYGEEDCTIRTYDNIEKYTGPFDRTIDLMLPVGRGNGYKFAILSGNTLNTVQMK